MIGAVAESVRDHTTMLDTKAGTSAYSDSNQAAGNLRYADSNAKSSMAGELNHTEQHLESNEGEGNHRMNSMPFYLKGAQQIASDEDVESF